MSTLRALMDGKPCLLVVDPQQLREVMGLTARVDAAGLARAEAVSVSTVKLWRRKGWIPYCKIGGNVSYDVDACRRALAARFGVPERKQIA